QYQQKLASINDRQSIYNHLLDQTSSNSTNTVMGSPSPAGSGANVSPNEGGNSDIISYSDLVNVNPLDDGDDDDEDDDNDIYLDDSDDDDDRDEDYVSSHSKHNKRTKQPRRYRGSRGGKHHTNQLNN